MPNRFELPNEEREPDPCAGDEPIGFEPIDYRNDETVFVDPTVVGKDKDNETMIQLFRSHYARAFAARMASLESDVLTGVK